MINYQNQTIKIDNLVNDGSSLYGTIGVYEGEEKREEFDFSTPFDINAADMITQVEEYLINTFYPDGVRV